MFHPLAQVCHAAQCAAPFSSGGPYCHGFGPARGGKGLCGQCAGGARQRLLHDIAKTYCLRHGGSHALLGGAWAVAETRNYTLAQGVMLHVHWPWPLPEGAGICALPFFVIYADKRVRHDACVPLEERYEDLLTRYGRTEAAREGIRGSYEQGKTIERALSAQLGWALHEDSFDCGRLVQ